MHAYSQVHITSTTVLKQPLHGKADVLSKGRKRVDPSILHSWQELLQQFRQYPLSGPCEDIMQAGITQKIVVKNVLSHPGQVTI